MAGDLRRAGSDLTAEAQAQAPTVMSNFPKKVETAEVVSLDVAPAAETFAGHAARTATGGGVPKDEQARTRDTSPPRSASTCCSASGHICHEPGSTSTNTGLASTNRAALALK